MPAASILIKPASANCNMDCKYCFYKCLSSNREQYSLGFMSKETLEKLIKNAIHYAEGSLTFAFQGGEPTLCGLDFFQLVVALQKKLLLESGKKLTIENTLQTNGLVIDEAWAKFFHENHFLIGLSLDGPKKLQDHGRVDVSGNETFSRVMHTVSLFREFQVDFNILTVVTEETAQKASSLYKFYKRNQFDFVQLIPCMDERNRSKDGEENPYAVKPESYGRFLMEMFDLWYEDFKAGDIMDIRMFSNLAQMAVGFMAEECGMNGCCNCYFVVEGDGSVYPCDFYCMDEYRIGTVDTSFEEIYQTEKVQNFLKSSQTVSADCMNCEHYHLCKGGCRRWREEAKKDTLSKNFLCEGYKAFFAHTKDRIEKLGNTILDVRNRAYL